jgi:RNA polymerase sigma-70 factor (ECF subfamily)
MRLEDLPGRTPLTTSEGEALLAAAQSGSPEALGRLLEAFRPYLLLLAGQELPADLQAKAGASDLVQDTFAEAHRDFPRFVGGSVTELLAWLQRILARNAADLAKRYRRTSKRRLDRELPLDDSSVSGKLRHQLAADSTSPSGKAVKREEAEALERALERLPEDHRRVILLHHRENRPFDEVARLMGRTEAAVRKLWARALRRWRQELEDLYGPP